MYGFSWVVDDSLAAMAKPGVRHPLAADLDYLCGQQITLLISLTEQPLPLEALGAHHLAGAHIPVADFTAPTVADLTRFVAMVRRELSAGGKVGVHCGAGLGRTGTFVAAYFVAEGLSPAEALRYVRELRPGSVETVAQEQAVFAYAQSLSE